MKIFLIGFMGSGKTTLGKKLARRMEFNFIDLDEYIERKESKKISKIFSSYGEEKFRIIEKENLRLLEILGETVISTGGGAPCFHQNMDWMNQNGLTVYLKHDPEDLYSRLKSSRKKRPLISGLTKTKLLEYIKDTLAEREVFYNQAQLIVEAKSIKPKELEDRVRDYLAGTREGTV
jgi:shikimate kinase